MYNYENWDDSYLPEFKIGDKLKPIITLTESSTSPPKLLSESDLISLMDKTGIGTDATIHEHIKTIQERGYAIKEYNHFVPTQIGVQLISAYKSINWELYKPYLRAQMEKDLGTVAAGIKTKEEVVASSLHEMYKIFTHVENNKSELVKFLQDMVSDEYQKELYKRIKQQTMEAKQQEIQNQQSQSNPHEDLPRPPLQALSLNSQNSIPSQVNLVICQWPKCKIKDIVIRKNKITNECFAAWRGFPNWKYTFSMPPTIQNFSKINQYWNECEKSGRSSVPMFWVKFKPELYKFDDIKNHINHQITNREVWLWPYCDQRMIQLDGMLKAVGLEKWIKPNFIGKFNKNFKKNKFVKS